MMDIKKRLASGCVGIVSLLVTASVSAFGDGVGQSIQIYTHFDSYYANPVLTIIVRDIDHNQNIPYIYEITNKDNFWLAFSYGKNYLITSATVAFNPSRYKTKNFCHLESNGKIIRGESLYVTIKGDLTPNGKTLNCSIMKYPDTNFTIVEPTKSE